MTRIAILTAAALLGSAFSVAPISSADAQSRLTPPPTRFATQPSRLVAPPSRLATPPARIVGGSQTTGRLISNDGSTFARNNAAVISRDGAGLRNGSNLISPGNRTGSSFR